MTLELIAQIKNAEENAGNLISDSLVSAREIVADAQKKKEMLIKQAYDDAAKKAEDISRKADEEVKLQTETIIRQAEKDGSLLKEKAAAEYDKTVQKVIERIVANGSS